MKTLNMLIAGLFLALLTACEPAQEVIGEGTLASPYVDCSIMQYLRNGPYNWDLTVEMIERAGLTEMFEGTVDTLPEITFLGFTKFSVMRYVYDQGKDSVAQLGVEECRDLVLRHVVKGKHLKESIDYQDTSLEISDPKQKGGTDFVTLGGGMLKFFLVADDYANVPGAGAVHMGIYSISAGSKVPTASIDIQPLNGVVHSLSDNYELGKI